MRWLLLRSLLLLATPALAGTPDLGFHPAAQGRGFTLLRDGAQPAGFGGGAFLQVDFGLNPVEVGGGAEGGRLDAVINGAFGMDLAASLSLTDWFQLGLRVPFLNVTGGSDEGFATAAAFGHDGAFIAFGDIGLDLGIGVLQQRRGHHVDVAVVPRFVFPTGYGPAWMGTGAFQAGGDLAVSADLSIVHIGANVGFMALLSEAGSSVVTEDSRDPVQTVGVIGTDDTFRWGLGVGLRLLDGQLEPQLEWNGSTIIARSFHEESGRGAFSGQDTPMELNLSVLVQPKMGPVWFRVGGGRGLSPGVGSPDLRLFGQLGFDVKVGEKPAPNIPVLTVDVRYRDKRLAETSVTVREAGGAEETVTVGADVATIDTEDGTAWTAAAARDCLKGTGSADVRNGRGALTIEMVADRTIPIEFDLKDPDGNPLTDATLRWQQDPDCIGCVPEEKAAIAAGQLRQMVCPGEHEVFVEKEGYRVVRSTIRAEAGTKQEVAVEMEPTLIDVAANQILILENVYFDTGSDVIQQRSHRLLEEIADTLLANRDLGNIEIHGHTDNVGDDASNLDLSTRRATAVLTFLIQQGVPGQRMVGRGLGETEPIDTNDTDAGREANRRVEFHIVDATPE
jgi:OmpA-OmpF porin, OOP family